MTRERYEYLATQIFQAALEVHKNFGPGLLESAYTVAFILELGFRNIEVTSQVKVPLIYKEMNTGKDFYIDLLVENEIIIELKAVEILLPVHHAQILSYMKLADKKLGFLINFNETLLKDGLKRKVLNYFI